MSTRSGRVRTTAIDTSPSRIKKGVSPPRSPARTRKISPPSKTSPARKSSPPARSSRKSPSRKSPSRKSASKFPARKSPSRSTNKEANEAPKSPAKRPALKTEKSLAVNIEDFSSKLETYRGTRSKRIEYSIKDVISSTTKDLSLFDKVNGLDSNDVFGLRSRRSAEEIAPRRSSRLKDFMDSMPEKRSFSKSISKSMSKSLEDYSDVENSEEELVKEKARSVTRKLATPLRGSEGKLIQSSGRWEFGGRFGSAALIIIIPLMVFSILVSCSKACSPVSLLDLRAYKSLSKWFNVHSILLVLGQCLVQAVFAIMPILGTKADRLDDSGTKYCFNAFFSSIFTSITLFILELFDVINTHSLLNEYLQMALISYIIALILSITLYLKSRKLESEELNIYGNTGYTLYDFFMGREVHPFIEKLDVKVWISRVSSINTLILAALIFKQGLHVDTMDMGELSVNNVKDILSKVHLKPTILLFSLMQLTYILNFIMKEHQVTTTFFWQSEGVGYLQTVSSALYPFYFTTISKFVADTQLSLSTNILITASILYLLGFFIMLISNNIKHKFRTNPLHPTMSSLESMPTFHGKKLLVSSFWGFLRHPNYFGDFLIHIALAMPGILTQSYMAAAPALLTICILLHRGWRDHSRCSRRYGAAWSRYCKRVPSVIVPKVL